MLEALTTAQIHVKLDRGATVQEVVQWLLDTDLAPRTPQRRAEIERQVQSALSQRQRARLVGR